jgi:hypothetical protein
VSLSGGEEASCVLDGFTIAGGMVGISCRDTSPTIRNCTIGNTGAIAIEFWGYHTMAQGPQIRQLAEKCRLAAPILLASARAGDFP